MDHNKTIKNLVMQNKIKKMRKSGTYSRLLRKNRLKYQRISLKKSVVDTNTLEDPLHLAGDISMNLASNKPNFAVCIDNINNVDTGISLNTHILLV